jgi:CIC family chloride channel protein
VGRWRQITENLGGRLRGVVSAHWASLLAWRGKWRPNEEAFHLILAALVGVVGGVVNLLFYLSVEWTKWMTLRQHDDLVEVAEMFSWWARLAAPALGGLAAGLILHWGRGLLGRGGSTNLLEVVVAGDGRLPLKSVMIKALSSLMSIATGASIGREGSITHLSATVASHGGQWAGWPPYRLRLLLACGAAAGMSAAYNAPIAGAVFAAQIVLGNFSMNLFAPLLCSSVVAAVVSRSFFGIEPWYQVPVFQFTRLVQLPWFLVLGALAGVLGALTLRLLRQGEGLFARTQLPIWARVALAGLVVGGIAVCVPQVWGNGYSVASRILDNRYDLAFLLILLAAKLLATVVTVASGAVGGVFTPTLFLGAALGAAFGHALDLVGWGYHLPPGVYALVGMGSVLAATTHSPLLSIIMLFEISLNYSLMPPLMIACAVSTLVARQLWPSSVYTEPLRQKGIQADYETEEPGAATQQTVGDVMREPVTPVRETAAFREIADHFLVTPYNYLPVVDAHRRLLGVVALQDLKEYLSAGQEIQGVIAYDVMRPPPPVLYPGQRLQEALPLLLGSELRNIPVVSDAKEFRLIGAVVQSEALGRISEAISARTTATL